VPPPASPPGSRPDPPVGAHVTLRHRVVAPVPAGELGPDAVGPGAPDHDETGAEEADPVRTALGPPDGEPPPTRPAQVLADLVGTVVALGSDRLVVRRPDGPEVSVRRDRVIAVRELPAPPRPARRPDRLRLEQVAAAAWPAVDTARLGDWVLRASGGWTRRANSALVLGSPGMDLDRALGACVRWYAERGLPPLVCVPLLPREPAAAGRPPGPGSSASPLPAGSPAGDVEAAGSAFGVFAAAGWTRTGVATVLTARTADVLAGLDDETGPAGAAGQSGTTDAAGMPGTAPAGPAGPTAPGGSVAGGIRLDAVASRAWLHDYRGADTAPGAAQVLAGPPAPARTRFATLVPTPDAVSAGAPVLGRGRAVTDGGWTGLSAVAVAPAARGRGAGRALVAVLLLDGLRHDGVRTYVQVDRTEPDALGFWLRLGYQVSHHYVYLSAPGPGPTSPGAVADTAVADTVGADTVGADAVRADALRADAVRPDSPG